MRKRVFIIEDDVNILCGLQAKFGLEGFESEACGLNKTTQEIIYDIRKIKPDFIVLDLILPNADGFEILKTIRKEEDLDGMSVFIFTNLSDEDSKARSRNLGFNNFFSKESFDIDGFVKKTLKILYNKDKLNV